MSVCFPLLARRPNEVEDHHAVGVEAWRIEAGLSGAPRCHAGFHSTSSPTDTTPSGWSSQVLGGCARASVIVSVSVRSASASVPGEFTLNQP
eukprot:CAMPEP_0180159030 /NCGR_PEP_ID=MMETSP0986-20121125/27280_1 /TAXON_ID=697907 /ORGANISM="non described non described, Strain CCMP2293" /LENGTH=91 /DNA_ID=CAMNT_0022109035 /DNA_START=255 /DNA_END=531 /DNA_ORIENTATION=+